jgi:hypothetical protein
MCTKPPTLRDKLSLEHVTSSLKKKSRTTFESQVVNLEEDEEQICLDEIGGGGGEIFYATTTQGNIKKELEPNLDKVIDNI